MSHGRKSQLDKFDARLKKSLAIKHGEDEFNAKQAQEPVLNKATKLDIKQGEMMMNTTDKGLKGDVFMAIDREAVEQGTPQAFFSGMAKEGVMDSLSAIEEASFKAQMRVFEMQARMMEEASYRGTLRALQDYDKAKDRGMSRAFESYFAMQQPSMSDLSPEPFTPSEVVSEEVVKEPFVDVSVEEIVELPPKEKRTGVLKANPKPKKKSGPKSKGVPLNYDELNELILINHNLGINVARYTQVKALGGTIFTMYQKFTSDNKGVKNAWKNYVQSVISRAVQPS